MKDRPTISIAYIMALIVVVLFWRGISGCSGKRTVDTPNADLSSASYTSSMAPVNSLGTAERAAVIRVVLKEDPTKVVEVHIPKGSLIVYAGKNDAQ